MNDKPIHRLSNIDAGAKTATCAICGPVKVHNVNARSNPKTSYVCSAKVKARRRSVIPQ